MSGAIGKITRIPLREVWHREDRDFTTWIRDNIDVVAEQLGLELVNAEREQAAGSFSVDIVAETDDGRAVVIENQLERSDHDHLGKLLTYLAAFDAKVAVWIVSEPRPEACSGCHLAESVRTSRLLPIEGGGSGNWGFGARAPLDQDRWSKHRD